MSRLALLRQEFIDRMIRGHLEPYPPGHAKAGRPNIEHSIRPFYFRSPKDGGHLQPSNADGTEVIAESLAVSLDIRTWVELQADEYSNKLLLNSSSSTQIKPFSGQTCGNEFEKLVRWYIDATLFGELNFLRPGRYSAKKGSELKNYEQYRHLNDFEKVIHFIPDSENALKLRLSAAFSSYAVKPDVVVVRHPIPRSDIEEQWRQSHPGTTPPLFDETVAMRTPLIAENTPNNPQILHAVISSKWTLRSDRAQNARTEGAFATQQRRGHAPHFVVVTGESKPSRIRSLTEGADVDCVYHFHLEELITAVEAAGGVERATLEQLRAMNRLRDITDLPFDLAI